MGNTVGSQRSLTVKQNEILIGTLLGDGHLEKNGRYVRLRAEHGDCQREYLFWKYNQFKSLVASPPRLVIHKDKRRKAPYKRWHFSTYSLPILVAAWKAWYTQGRKRIPDNIMDVFSSPLSLAVWIMDDGYRRNDCCAMRINCESFSLEEQKILQNCLRSNFGLNSRIHGKGKYWNLYIPSSEFRKLNKIVAPYFHSSMMYKIRLL